MRFGSWDGVAEPDLDGRDVDRSLVDDLAFVVTGRNGPELAELVDAPLDGVALLVELGVEVGRAAAGRAALARCCFWSSLIGMTA